MPTCAYIEPCFYWKGPVQSMPTCANIEPCLYLERTSPIHAYLCLYWALFLPGKDQPNPCLPVQILSPVSTWKGPTQSMPTCAYIKPCFYLERASPLSSVEREASQPCGLMTSLDWQDPPPASPSGRQVLCTFSHLQGTHCTVEGSSSQDNTILLDISH